MHHTVWRFDLGRVDPERFVAAFDDLARRADALRMVVEQNDGWPRLRCLAGVAGRHEQQSVTSQNMLETAMKERSGRAFNLALQTVDSVLYVLPDGSATWLLNLHHIVNDAATGPILLAALAESYEAGHGVLPPLPSFADHMRRTHIPQADRGIWDSWRRVVPTVPRCYGQALSGAQIKAVERRIDLSQHQAERLIVLRQQKGFANRNHSHSMSQIFQTALLAWMRFTTQEARLAIGVATDGRVTAQEKQMAGCFLEVQPLEARVDDAETFRSLHAKLRAAHMPNLNHATPGRAEVRCVARFAAVINVLSPVLGEFASQPVKATSLETGCIDPTQALRLTVLDAGNCEPTLNFLFNSDIIPEADADRAVAQFMAFLNAMLTNPDAPLVAASLTRPLDLAPYAAVALPQTQAVVTAIA